MLPAASCSFCISDQPQYVLAHQSLPYESSERFFPRIIHPRKHVSCSYPNCYRVNTNNNLVAIILTSTAVHSIVYMLLTNHTGIAVNMSDNTNSTSKDQNGEDVSTLYL